MKLYPIETGYFKLDGGAMFGIVPKTIWNKTNPADANNLINLAMRCLLIEDGDRLILIDTGIGNKQNEKFFSFYYLFGDVTLDQSLAKHGFHRDDITDVFLTHLHFDHCGGAIQWNNSKEFLEPAFKNATFWSNEGHWNWATEPNPREKASFLKENILPIQDSGQLKMLSLPKEGENRIINTPLGFDVMFVDGHTEKQMLPIITYKGKKIVYIADLIPTTGNIPLIYVIGFDTRPLLTVDEKGKFLDEAIENEYILFFEHDFEFELATLKRTEKGIRLAETFSFTEVFG
ncbi:MBL fold metallo-hydrolase [Faecalibacter rhinopitheci]|uniref:MBL fold metallo-hydrolase n=1 Tax=Faecalibacter rhinopitheci TaxID=2779678 RepID=A0A8J7FQN4_9FLAO|nr:MBL fold metallo-hydrolase [Faecalibacter rhinopitheci]MBF0597744.1 MBL fold metallo-hydrolase [Faecalibacter rhinopitheci]